MSCLQINQPISQHQPASQPANQASKQASSQPTNQPSNQPSNHPVNRASIQPTKQASSQPSKHPANQASIQPTNQPAKQVSSQPTNLLPKLMYTHCQQITHNILITYGVYHVNFNSLWPSDALWQHRSWSTLAQIMACCPMTPRHHPNQSILIMHICFVAINWE